MIDRRPADRGARPRHDYDDLLLYWAQMMSDPGLASDVGNRFDQVLVDEFQDTNRLQASILLALKPSGVGLTVVAGLATGFSAVCPLLRRLMAIARHPVISKWNQWFRFAALLADALRADEALHGDVATPVDEGLGELPARALVNSTRTHITAVRNGGLGER